MSFILVPVPKPVDVFLFSQTRATYTVYSIHLFAVQYKSWRSLLHSFILFPSPSYTHTYVSALNLF